MGYNSIRIIITASLLILLFAVYTHSEEITITTNDGTVTVGSIIRTEPDGVVIEIPLGVKKVYYKDMPVETARKYGYDPQKEEAYKKQVELDKKKVEFDKKKAVYQREVAKLKKKTPIFDGNDFNVGKIGRVGWARIKQIINESSMLADIAVDGKNVRGPNNPITVWVEGFSTKDLVDGRYVELPVLKVIKTKTYTTAFGSKTVFVLTPTTLPPSPDILLNRGNNSEEALH